MKPKELSSRSGSTVLGILALISAICFLALIALQVMEWMHYGADPSIWPPS